MIKQFILLCTRLIVFLFAILMLFITSQTIAQQPTSKNANQDQDSDESPYSTFWEQVQQLLADREYGSAADLISDAETDSALAAYKTQLATDRKDVEVLQRFANLVAEQAAALKPGTKLTLGLIEHTVIKFVDDAEGERLILSTAKSSTPVEKSLDELDYRIWIDLTQSKITTSRQDRYMLGMYLASVARGNRKEARQILNLAAADGMSARGGFKTQKLLNSFGKEVARWSGRKET